MAVSKSGPLYIIVTVNEECTCVPCSSSSFNPPCTAGALAWDMKAGRGESYGMTLLPPNSHSSRQQRMLPSDFSHKEGRSSVLGASNMKVGPSRGVRRCGGRSVEGEMCMREHNTMMRSLG